MRKVAVHMKMGKALVDQLDRFCETTGLARSEVVRAALVDYLPARLAKIDDPTSVPPPKPPRPPSKIPPPPKVRQLQADDSWIIDEDYEWKRVPATKTKE